MSFGSFMGRLAALTGLHSATTSESTSVLGSAQDALNDPFNTATSALGRGRWGSILFGSGHSGKWHIEDMLELRRALFWIAVIVVLLLIAAITNPTEASFRSHLTELSFRRHLADIRSSDSNIAGTEEEGTSHGSTTLPSSSSETAVGTTTVSHQGGTETPPIAPFRFANHVAISLRTPPLYYKTLFFLSLALTSPLAPPAYLSDPVPVIGKKPPAPPPRERKVLFVGYLGHWAVVGQVPRKVEWMWRLFTETSKEKGKKKNTILDRPGVTELRSIASKEDSSLAPKAITAIPHNLSSTRHVRKSDSISNLADHGTLPLHTHPAPIPVAPFVPESRRASIVNLVNAQPVGNASGDSSDSASSPLISALKADLATAQTALAEVKAQLHAHEESVSSAHQHLQTSLDEVRTRRKEDDAERQELKSRTKSLEDQKRQAESARREAEKKLKAVEVVRDGLEARIKTALSEIGDLKGLMEVSSKNLRTVQEEGAKFDIETRDMIEGKKEELEEIEGDIGELDARNEELGRAIKEAEEKVESALKAGEEARKIGPEEEMMMMAAAYEAAAQEGYSHQPHGSGHGHGFRDGRNGAGSGDQWAHQAAQYMAEAGMPHVDPSYSARPSHSTSFGQFAKAHKAVEEKRPADLIGFEDFGPGAKNRRMTTPPASDSGSDVWGHDPGSPNGGISSSFSANLLPQGLFRSLEGDQTPMDATTDADDESLAGAFIPEDEHEHPRDADGDIESGSESSDDRSEQGPGHAAWRSPLPAPGAIHPYQSSSERQLLPPSSHTPPGQNPPTTTAALPGLPAPLPGSRRWYSGTNSSEHVNNVFGVSPSNDSLLMGYEASPFAPTSSEKQQLALKWGALSKRWARNDPAVPSSTGGPVHPGTTRSVSADLAAGWLHPRFKKDMAQDETHGDHGDQEQGQGQGQLQPPGEKKPFRFFSLRRPTSSGSAADRSGTSPVKGE